MAGGGGERSVFFCKNFSTMPLALRQVNLDRGYFRAVLPLVSDESSLLLLCFALRKCKKFITRKKKEISILFYSDDSTYKYKYTHKQWNLTAGFINHTTHVFIYIK